MRVTRCFLLCASIAALLAVPGVASAEPMLVAPGTTDVTAPTGIARTPDGAVWVADEVRGICRVGAGVLVESPWCGPGQHNEDETEDPEETEAPVGADAAATPAAPADPAGAPVVPTSVSGLAFDPRSDNFYVGDRASSGGGVWRLHYDRTSGVIDGATEIVSLADRVETLALGPQGDLYFATKRAGQVLRIADPAGQTGALELVATLGGGTDETNEVEFEIASMAATDDALYLGGVGVSRLSLTDPNPTPQPVAGFEGRETAAVAVDNARGRLYVGDVDPQLGDIVEVVDVASGDHEPYEHGFATVTTLGVDSDGTVLVADDPSLATQFTAWQARIWAIPVQSTGRPEATITSTAGASTAAEDVRFAYASRDGATFECRLDGGAFAPCAGTGSGEHAYHDVPEGKHVFSVRATEGGLTGLVASVRFTIDRTAPKVVAIQPTTEYLEGISIPRIRFSANESGITYTCSVDGGPFKRCFSGNPIEGLTPGVHVLRIVGTDAAGNASNPNDPAATVRIVVHARWAPAAETPAAAIPAAAIPAAGAVAVAGTTASSEHKPLLFPFTLRYKDAAGKTRVLRFGLDAPHGSAQLRVTVKDWRARTVLSRVVTVRGNARNSVALTLTRADQRRLRPGRYLVRAVLRTAHGLEGNAQTHWLRVRR
jgi:hypothetical protein